MKTLRKRSTPVPILLSRLAMVALAALLVAGLSPTAKSSTFVKMGISTLRGRSESVVQAQVARMRSERIGGGMIFTYVTLNVTRTLHGKSATELVVKVPGGTVDGYTIRMEGAPEFQRGSTVVAFIGRWDDGSPMVAGYSQGLSKVTRDALGNQTLQGGVGHGLTVAGLARQLASAGGNR